MRDAAHVAQIPRLRAAAAHEFGRRMRTARDACSRYTRALYVKGGNAATVAIQSLHEYCASSGAKRAARRAAQRVYAGAPQKSERYML